MSDDWQDWICKAQSSVTAYLPHNVISLMFGLEGSRVHSSQIVSLGALRFFFFSISKFHIKSAGNFGIYLN